MLDRLIQPADDYIKKSTDEERKKLINNNPMAFKPAKLIKELKEAVKKDN